MKRRACSFCHVPPFVDKCRNAWSHLHRIMKVWSHHRTYQCDISTNHVRIPKTLYVCTSCMYVMWHVSKMQPKTRLKWFMVKQRPLLSSMSATNRLKYWSDIGFVRSFDQSREERGPWNETRRRPFDVLGETFAQRKHSCWSLYFDDVLKHGRVFGNLSDLHEDLAGMLTSNSRPDGH